jgi:ankyrin repeat protein
MKQSSSHTTHRSKLFSLAENGRLGDIKDLIRAHSEVSVEWTKGDNKTLLMIAAEKGHASLVSWLIEEKNANVLAVDTHGNTLLHLAARCNSIPTLKMCLAQIQKGLDPDALNRQMQTPLINELQAWQNAERVSMFLKAGANASYPFNQPIGIACKRNSHTLLPLLVEAGADISHVFDPDRNDDWRWSFPLPESANNASLECVKWLLEAGANIQERNESGNNALGCVAMCRTSPYSNAVAQVLLDAGIDPLNINLQGKMALDIVDEMADPQTYALIKRYTEHAALTAQTSNQPLPSPAKYRL